MSIANRDLQRRRKERILGSRDLKMMMRMMILMLMMSNRENVLQGDALQVSCVDFYPIAHVGIFKPLTQGVHYLLLECFINLLMQKGHVQLCPVH